MARKAVRSLEPLKWMAAGSFLTLMIVWGPHKLFHTGYDAGTSAAASVRAVF